MNTYQYQVGGSLTASAPSYVIRQADTEIYHALKSGQFCYVLNSRQMGKSSLLVRIRHQLEQEGFQCSSIDMTRIGTENITPEQWYKGIIAELWRGFKLVHKFNLKSWWNQEEEIPILQKLGNFIEDVLLKEFPESHLMIFVDEIDSILSLDFPIDDFFALIRFCYNQRANNPEYHRITFAIFGVATPSDLIQDKNRTPFNIGKAIELQGFTLHESQALIQGLETKFKNSKLILEAVLSWTNGQPFLTQKICQIIVDFSHDSMNERLAIPPGTEYFWVENIVRTYIIDKWESQDEPEHLKTIRDRLLRNEKLKSRLLGLYQKILQSELFPETNSRVNTDDSQEQIELQLAGLVIKEGGYLKLKNRIYQEIFNLDWVAQKLSLLRPYSQVLAAWLTSDQQDESRLLRGQALQDALSWSQGKRLSDEDYQFLAASQDLDKQEVQQALEIAKAKVVEAQLAEEQKNTERQRILLIIVSGAFIITTILGMIAFQQYRRAVLNEIKAITTSSNALFSSNQTLDALKEAIKGWQKQKKLGDVDPQTQRQVEEKLRQAVYGVSELNRLSDHKAPIWKVKFSPDGNLIASASRDKTVKIWQPDGTLLTTLSQHKGWVLDVAFSPDGQFLATVGDDQTIVLWQIHSEHQISLVQVLGQQNSEVLGAAFSPDGKLLATAQNDGVIKLWQVEPGVTPMVTLVQTIEASKDKAKPWIWEVKFSPDGQILASVGGDHKVKLWKIHRSAQNQTVITLLQTLRDHQGSVYGLDFSPDGRLMVTGSLDNTVKLWRLNAQAQTVAELQQTFTGHTDGVWGVAFNPDGTLIASTGLDQTIIVWDLQGIPVTKFKGHNGEIFSVDFNPSGTVLASASADNQVKLWKIKSDLFTTLTGHQERVWNATFSPDGNLIATASFDKTIKLWRPDGKLLNTLEGHQDGVWKVAFSSDGLLMASGSQDQTAKIWQFDPKTNQARDPQTLSASQEAVYDVTFSPTAPVLATASSDKLIRLWEVGTNPSHIRLINTFGGHQDRVYTVAFSPDGNLLASGSDDNMVRLWSRAGQLLTTINAHSGKVSRVVFSPDGNFLVSGSDDTRVKLWRRDGTFVKSFIGHTAAVNSVAFSSDGQLIASASADQTVKLWRRDGGFVATLKGHEAGVYSVMFSPDNRTLASAGLDRKVILWHLDRVVDLNQVVEYGCHWLGDYLRTNPELDEEDRRLCGK